LSKPDEIEIIRKKIQELEKRVEDLEKGPSLSLPKAPKWVQEVSRGLETAVNELGSVILFSYATRGSLMTTGDSKEKIVNFKSEQVSTLLKGLDNIERIKILKILMLEQDGKYAQELLKQTELSDGSLHYHLRWLLKSQMIMQELGRGKYKITHLGVMTVSLIGLLTYSMKTGRSDEGS